MATYEPQHEAAVHAAHQEAFADHWEHEVESLEEWRKWLVESPGFDPTFWFLAWDGDELAGLSLCRIHSSGDAEHGYVGCSPCGGPGGVAALEPRCCCTRSATCAPRHDEASLGVDAENLTGAVGLYERAGM